MELVEAVVRFRKCDSAPPRHLLGWVERQKESWRLNPARMLEAGAEARSVWVAFDEWRRNWEQRWRLGDKGELLEVIELGADGDPIDLSSLPVVLGSDAQVRLAAIAAEAREKLEAGTLPGWLLRGDDGSTLRGRDRVLIDSAPRLELRPESMLLNGKRVVGWELDGVDGTIVFSEGTRLSREPSRVVQLLLPGSSSVQLERTTLSAPWANTAGQLAKACVASVSREVPLHIQLAE